MCIKLHLACKKKNHYQKYNMKLIRKHTRHKGHVSAISSVQNVYFGCFLIYEKKTSAVRRLL